MTLNVRICCSFILLFLSTSAIAVDDAEIVIKQPFSIESKNETVTAIKPDPGPIAQEEAKFKFDWSQYSSRSLDKNKIAAEEKFISKINDVSKLNYQEQQALGRLFYKMGAYYTHVAYEPDLAITKLTMANAMLTDLLERAWSYNQTAYAYEQKYAALDSPEDKEIALFYVNKVISEMLPNMKSKPVAFAYTIKGLIQNDAKEYTDAEKNFKAALAMYETLPNGKDDQYVKAKTGLAEAFLGQDGHEKEAISLLKQTKRYWSQKGHLTRDPYAANSIMSLGKAYLKTGQARAARDEFQTAVNIYENVYGDHNPILVKPYQLLAQAYKQLGRLDQASAYEQKADDINNA